MLTLAPDGSVAARTGAVVCVTAPDPLRPIRGMAERTGADDVRTFCDWPVRSLFVFPHWIAPRPYSDSRSQAYKTQLPIGVSRPGTEELIWAEVIDDLSAADFDASSLAEIEQAAGLRPRWGLEVAISGRFADWRQRDLRALTVWLLSDGGVASSIESDRFRTADEWRAHWESIGQPI